MNGGLQTFQFCFERIVSRTLFKRVDTLASDGVVLWSFDDERRAAAARAVSGDPVKLSADGIDRPLLLEAKIRPSMPRCSLASKHRYLGTGQGSLPAERS